MIFNFDVYLKKINNKTIFSEKILNIKYKFNRAILRIFNKVKFLRDCHELVEK